MANDSHSPAQRPARGNSRLDSWKEIAAYFNRHVTTVRRWEKTERLPVHRHVHDKLGSVYAFPDELDAWWHSRGAQLESTNGGEVTPHGGPLERERPFSSSGVDVEPVRVAVGGRPSPGDASGFRDSLQAATPVGSEASSALPWWILGAPAALLVTIVIGGYTVSRVGDAPRPEIQSLAVLPLQNLSNDPTQEYFADGMTDTLITHLAQIHSLHVISRTSAMRFKDRRTPLPEIARGLGVDAVIEGSVQRIGDRVKITVQLIDGSTDHHIWAREYERHLADALTLQGEVAQAVAREIRIRVTPEEHARLASVRSVDPTAHEAYLLGRYHAWKLNEDDLKLAITHFERAIRIEPQFAAAHADLSLAWQYRSVFASTPFDESEIPARAAAQVALSLDEGLAAAHLAAGHFKYAYELDYAAAEADFRRALDLDSNSVDAHYYYAKLLQSLGRFSEAIDHLERARALDPLSSSVASFLGRTLYRAGQYSVAVRHLQRAIELEPRNATAYNRLHEVYEEMGRYDEALAYHEQEYERTGRLPHLSSIARLQARMGKRQEARRTLEHVKAFERPEPGVAAVYAALRDNDEAFRLLRKAFEDRDHSRLLFIKVDPPLASLRSDPRWPELLELMNLPQ